MDTRTAALIRGAKQTKQEMDEDLRWIQEQDWTLSEAQELVRQIGRDHGSKAMQRANEAFAELRLQGKLRDDTAPTRENAQERLGSKHAWIHDRAELSLLLKYARETGRDASKLATQMHAEGRYLGNAGDPGFVYQMAIPDGLRQQIRGVRHEASDAEAMYAQADMFKAMTMAMDLQLEASSLPANKGRSLEEILGPMPRGAKLTRYQTAEQLRADAVDLGLRSRAAIRQMEPKLAAIRAEKAKLQAEAEPMAQVQGQAIR